MSVNNMLWHMTTHSKSYLGKRLAVDIFEDGFIQHLLHIWHISTLLKKKVKQNNFSQTEKSQKRQKCQHILTCFSDRPVLPHPIHRSQRKQQTPTNGKQKSSLKK